ncbi:metallophosphoesterase family protein [Methylomonas sp. EFPC3]|uniref:metallophosphoesterase family protein n=1 Tax=Methylomonas sp. EFPC3 TaxID=3021710 RepID=UPI0024176A9E|nr:metallophosphoesterase family protein [Methylomonas sp. EFPC3]WFP50632.1 metallophosphoesterase family protein [Methylomonas sp. EFPC3]
MKIGLLGDIHGNSLALEAVLASAKAKNVEILCLTGDFVGYYYSPDRVLDMLTEWSTFAVAGNHEHMLFESLESAERRDEYLSKYGSGLISAACRLSPSQLEWLRKLPAKLELDISGQRILLAHGAPWDTDCYLYPDAPEPHWTRAAEGNFDLVVLGHTHYRFQRKIGRSLIVNPGSVGQPRDRIPGAAWAVFDTDTMVCEHYSESYDVSTVIQQARVNDPNKKYLQEVLVRR